MSSEENEPVELSPTIHIRPAEKRDAENLMAFIAPFVAENRLLHRTEEELDSLIASGFVAETNNYIIGFAALEVYSSKLGEIRSLAVSPLYQGVGVGKMLVEACVSLAKDRNVLEVMAITASEDFFLSCGFDFTLPGQKKALFLQTRER